MLGWKDYSVTLLWRVTWQPTLTATGSPAVDQAYTEGRTVFAVMERLTAELFATYVRNTADSDNILYVGPMGCRTGFYFITRDKISKARAIELVQETCAFIEHFEGEIPGSSRIECGNYLDHSLPKAKQYAHDLAKTLAGWTEEKMVYQL